MLRKGFLFVVLAMIVTETVQVNAQNIAVTSGVLNYDLSGTGNTPSVAMSADWSFYLRFRFSISFRSDDLHHSSVVGLELH